MIFAQAAIQDNGSILHPNFVQLLLADSLDLHIAKLDQPLLSVLNVLLDIGIIKVVVMLEQLL